MPLSTGIKVPPSEFFSRVEWRETGMVEARKKKRGEPYPPDLNTSTQLFPISTREHITNVYDLEKYNMWKVERIKRRPQ